MNPIGPGYPFTLLFGEETAGEPSLPAPFRQLYGSDWQLPPTVTKPYIYSNFASSRDGRVSYNELGIMSGGDVTDCNPHDRWLMGLLRARADAIMMGDSTVKIEPEHVWIAEHICPSDAEAFVALRQAEGRTPKPLLVIVSYDCSFGTEAACFAQPDLHIVLATTAAGYANAQTMHCAAHLDVVQLGEEWVDLPKLIQLLYHDYGRQTILCEGGPRLMGGMLAAGLVDEEFLTLCPRFIGETRDNFRPSYVEGVNFLPSTTPYSKPHSLRRAGDFLFMQTRLQYS